MNKQDKEKAHQTAWETSKHYDPLLSKESWCEMAALDMAAWKEQQMIDRAKEFISTWFYEHPHTSWLICSDEFQDLDDCLERLEKEMKEEN